MVKLQFASSFRKDYDRREGDEDAIRLVQAVFHLLENELPLPPSLRDHKLVGNLSHCREVHVKGNLLLIYERCDGIVKLHRLCNHSELFNL